MEQAKGLEPDSGAIRDYTQKPILKCSPGYALLYNHSVQPSLLRRMSLWPDYGPKCSW